MHEITVEIWLIADPWGGFHWEACAEGCSRFGWGEDAWWAVSEAVAAWLGLPELSDDAT